MQYPQGENVRRSAVVAGRVQFANDEISALHRLDRSTGGVLLLCKRREHRGAFHKMFEQRSVSKTYWAVASLNGRVDAEPVRVESRINKTQGELQAREDPGRSMRSRMFGCWFPSRMSPVSGDSTKFGH